MADITVTGTGAAPPSGTLVCSTELEAVNTILSTIGEQPVEALDGSFNEATLAQDMLRDISREVQTRGYSWNKETEYPLAVTGGEILISTDCLDVNITNQQDWLVQRGNRLYNRTEHTYTFAADVDVEATIIFFLAFADLPQVAKNYITLRTARKFQVRMLGSESIEKFSEIDENQAWLTLSAKEVDQGAYSLKSGMDYKLWLNRG